MIAVALGSKSRGVERRDVDRLVIVAVLVERVVERASERGRIPDQEQLRVLRRKATEYRVEDELLDPRRLVDNHQDVLAVEPLEPLRCVRRKPERVPLVREFKPRLRHLAADKIPVPTVQRPDLPPQQLLNLAIRRRGSDHHRVLVRHQPPQRSNRRSISLARTVARPHRHEIVRDERLKDVPLLLPRLSTKIIRCEPNRIVLSLPALIPSQSVPGRKSFVHSCITSQLLHQQGRQ